MTKGNLIKKLVHSIYFALGSISCLAIFEALSRFGGMSYIKDSLRLSGTIVQGSFEESFSFIIKYLFDIEGVSGIILIIGLILFCFVLIFHIKNKTLNSIHPYYCWVLF